MTKGFNSYRLYYHSTPRYSWQSRLYLYKDGVYVGSMFFMKEGENIPDNIEIGGHPRLHFPSAKFGEIMNVLRHEDPLYLTLVTTNGIGTISTSNEPIGEEEKD